MLAFTKYFNFVGESVSAITGGTFTALDIIVPLGISFYTFQSTGISSMYTAECMSRRKIR